MRVHAHLPSTRYFVNNWPELSFLAMSGEECVQMVRDFCGVMADWQPNIRENLEDPIMLGLHCLAAADLFKQAFVKAYANTSSRLEAQEAIDKALGDLS